MVILIIYTFLKLYAFLKGFSPIKGNCWRNESPDCVTVMVITEALSVLS